MTKEYIDEMISIIIPVYNTPISDLQCCFTSILEQTYSKWEALIIDDGSCREIHDELDSWVKKDPRFIVIHQENSGVSIARNVGIEKAIGGYIAFLDADDCLKNVFLSEAVQYMNEYSLDMIIGSVEAMDKCTVKMRKCASYNKEIWIYERGGVNLLLDYMITAHCKKQTTNFMI